MRPLENWPSNRTKTRTHTLVRITKSVSQACDRVLANRSRSRGDVQQLLAQRLDACGDTRGGPFTKNFRRVEQQTHVARAEDLARTRLASPARGFRDIGLQAPDEDMRRIEILPLRLAECQLGARITKRCKPRLNATEAGSNKIGQRRISTQIQVHITENDALEGRRDLGDTRVVRHRGAALDRMDRPAKTLRDWRHTLRRPGDLDIAAQRSKMFLGFLLEDLEKARPLDCVRVPSPEARIIKTEVEIILPRRRQTGKLIAAQHPAERGHTRCRVAIAGEFKIVLCRSSESGRLLLNPRRARFTEVKVELEVLIHGRRGICVCRGYLVFRGVEVEIVLGRSRQP